MSRDSAMGIRRGMPAIPSHKAPTGFWHNESGAITVELVIYLPFLLWVWLNLFAYWDAYHQANISQKAIYSVADMITREQTAIDDSYRDGLRKVFAHLMDLETGQVRMRITSLTYSMDSEASGSFKVQWSYSPDGEMDVLSSDKLNAQYLAHIPAMAVGDSAIMIETHVPYAPPIHYDGFGLWQANDEIADLIVMRPRFMRICESGKTCS
jgi:hypothetical protein